MARPEAPVDTVVLQVQPDQHSSERSPIPGPEEPSTVADKEGVYYSKYSSDKSARFSLGSMEQRNALNPLFRKGSTNGLVNIIGDFRYMIDDSFTFRIGGTKNKCNGRFFRW